MSLFSDWNLLYLSGKRPKKKKKKTWKYFNTKFGPHWKDRKGSYQVTITYNCVLFHLRWKENLMKKSQKMMKMIVDTANHAWFLYGMLHSNEMG